MVTLNNLEPHNMCAICIDELLVFLAMAVCRTVTYSMCTVSQQCVRSCCLSEYGKNFHV